MAPWVKVLATTKSDELSLIPGTHMVGKEKKLTLKSCLVIST